MITPAQIKKKAEQKYPIFLTAIVTDSEFFPIGFTVGAIPKDFLNLREVVTQLVDQSKATLGYGYTLELAKKQTRKFGEQSLPQRIYIETEKDYLKLINKVREVDKFRANLHLLQTQIPQLQDWLARNPLKVAEYADRWPELIKVCRYFLANPQPHLYIRELPIQVHTKFIEQHKPILRSLLEALLPPEQLGIVIDRDHPFEQRFSLKYPEPLIRLRVLDVAIKDQYHFPASDLSLPLSELRQLNFQFHRCVITENLMNFLTLPPLENTIALFGKGYAIQSANRLDWLANCAIFYWGDLDADGFKILSQLRSYWSQTVSVMMDRLTFSQFTAFAVTVTGESCMELPYLTPDEREMYTYLCDHNLRLEQERIHQPYANKILQNL